MTKSLLAIASILALVSAAPLHAQPRHEKHRPSKETVEAFRQWFTTTVAPTLLTWQQEFDATLTSADLATVKRLRTELSQKREQLMAELKASRPEGKLTAEQRQALKEKRKEGMADLKEIAKQVKPIAEKSKENLRKILEEHASQMKAWRDEAEQKFGEKTGRMLSMLGADKRKSAIRFILWDGKAPAPPVQPKSDDKSFQQHKTVQGSYTIEVAPNPAESVTRVTMSTNDNRDNVNAGSSATLAVADLNGNVVSMHETSLEHGRIDTMLPTNTLQSGTYILNVMANGVHQSHPLIVSR